MKSKLLKIKEELKKRINFLDKIVKEYKDISNPSYLPNTAYMNWGVRLADQGNIDEAINKLKTATLMANQNPNVYINLGIALLKQKDFDGAIKNFRQAVKIDKFNSKAYAMWASALSEIGDLKGAIDIYKIAQKYNPRDAEIFLNWGVSLARAGRSSEAEEKFRKAVSLNPLNPITPFLWGLILFEQQKFDEAIKKFNHCLLYTDNEYDTLYYLGLSYLKLNNYKMAFECAEKANKSNPAQCEPYLIMAECYMNTCKPDDCLKMYETAEQNATTPLNSRFYTNWGIALQKYNHLEEAREKLYKALMIEPNNEMVLFNLGVNFLLTKENSLAEEFFLKVLDKNPLHAQSLYNVASLAYNRQDFEYALSKYFSSLEANPQNKMIYFNIANCYHKLNKIEQAKVYFKKCIEYCPDFIQGYLNYANILLETGEILEAKRKARSAYLKDKDSAYTNFAYGVVLLKLSEFDESIEKFEAAANIDTNYDLAYLGLCEAYLNKQDYEKCISNLYKVSKEGSKTHEYDELESRLFDKILNCDKYNEGIKQSVLHSAYEYCNIILERYNNNKVQFFKSVLIEKFNLEA